MEPCHVLCLENGKKRCKSQDDEDKCDNKSEARSGDDVEAGKIPPEKDETKNKIALGIAISNVTRISAMT